MHPTSPSGQGSVVTLFKAGWLMSPPLFFNGFLNRKSDKLCKTFCCWRLTLLAERGKKSTQGLGARSLINFCRGHKRWVAILFTFWALSYQGCHVNIWILCFGLLLKTFTMWIEHQNSPAKRMSDKINFFSISHRKTFGGGIKWRERWFFPSWQFSLLGFLVSWIN